MKEKILLAVVCAFCIIIPVHATENAEQSNEEQETVVEDSALSLLEMTKENEYQIYQKQLSARLCGSQIEYLDALYLQMQEEYEIAKTKYELGYITEVELKEAELGVNAVILQKDTAEEQLEFYKACIALRGGVFEADMPEVELPELSKDYVADYLEQSGQLVAYQEVNLREYVMGKQLQYKTLLRQIRQCDDEIAIMQIKLQNQKLLYESGEAAKSTLAAMETEMQQLKYGRTSYVCDAGLILYELEHTIEN